MRIRRKWRFPLPHMIHTAYCMWSNLAEEYSLRFLVLLNDGCSMVPERLRRRILEDEQGALNKVIHELLWKLYAIACRCLKQENSLQVILEQYLNLLSLLYSSSYCEVLFWHQCKTFTRISYQIVSYFFLYSLYLWLSSSLNIHAYPSTFANWEL